MVATDWPSVAKANLNRATSNRRRAKSWSESHHNGKMMRRRGADVMWFVCIVLRNTSFTNEDEWGR